MSVYVSYLCSYSLFLCSVFYLYFVFRFIPLPSNDRITDWLIIWWVVRHTQFDAWWPSHPGHRLPTAKTDRTLSIVSLRHLQLGKMGIMIYIRFTGKEYMIARSFMQSKFIDDLWKGLTCFVIYDFLNSFASCTTFSSILFSPSFHVSLSVHIELPLRTRPLYSLRKVAFVPRQSRCSLADVKARWCRALDYILLIIDSDITDKKGL